MAPRGWCPRRTVGTSVCRWSGHTLGVAEPLAQGEATGGAGGLGAQGRALETQGANRVLVTGPGVRCVGV